MTVSELIAELQKEDGNRQVILAKDAEGNGYSPLDYIWKGAYRPFSSFAGKAGLEALADEDRDLGFTEEDVINGQKAVILCPTN